MMAGKNTKRKKFNFFFKHPTKSCFTNNAVQKLKLKKLAMQHEKSKKFKHIKRAKETEKLLCRQKDLEVRTKREGEAVDSSCSDEDINLMDQLISSLQSTQTNGPTRIGVKRNAVDSSDNSSEEEQQDEDSNQYNISKKDTVIIRSSEVENDSISNENQLNNDDEIYDEIEKEDFESSSLNHNEDRFSEHLNNLLSPEMIECVNKTTNLKCERLDWPKLGKLLITIPKPNTSYQANGNMEKGISLMDTDLVYASDGKIPLRIDYKCQNLSDLMIKKQIHPHFIEANKKNLKNEAMLTTLQAEILSIANNYQDFYYADRNLENGEEIRFIYCLHALNHVLKTRTKILQHNAKLQKVTQGGKRTEILLDAYRDHGLFRPKVIIIVPFKESALRVVNYLISLLFPQLGGSVMNHKKFLDEFTGETIFFPKTNPKPEDYELTFAGNTDDMFRIGLCITRKCLKLYTNFYASDIIIASPLGLRTIVGALGEKERDYDFLSTIELLIIDQADIIMAQNWDHLLHVLEHFHLQPKSAGDIDFARVRTWCLNGWAKFYRQTLLFASHDRPEFRSLFNSKCCNYRGKIRTIIPVVGGSIRHVAVCVPQTFHRIDVTTIEASYNQRFNFFITHCLPQFKGPLMAHCLIYVPSYFDYVRLRNYFKKESINFVQICEYTKEAKIARSRDMFFHSSAHFLLYSERAHYFRRIRLKGIRHVVMYQPPMWSSFYSEMLNLMQDVNQNPRDGGNDASMTVTVLYTKYDMLQVAGIVGTERAEKMISDKQTHMFMTGD